MTASLDMNRIVGTHDVALITLDTLRFDAAQALFSAGRTPTLTRAIGPLGWEPRHTPSTFTYGAHHAFFAGFLPTPIAPGPHPRLFAMRFEGSATTDATTCVLDAADIPSGLADHGYHTACIGGTGFFNGQNALGRVLPSRFIEAHWQASLGVTDPRSTEHQVRLAAEILARTPDTQRVFLFINVSAIHQPNRCYVPGAAHDSLTTHAAALAYVDTQLDKLFTALARRGPALCIVCSDHGTAYGEDGYAGHRVAHPVVWTVPYAQFVIARDDPRFGLPSRP